jgi:hypothetical protein
VCPNLNLLLTLNHVFGFFFRVEFVNAFSPMQYKPQEKDKGLSFSSAFVTDV